MRKNEAYDTLGLSPEANEDEIKKAFRKAAAASHPDVNKDNPKAEENFKKINQAFQILSGKEHAEDEMPQRSEFHPGSPFGMNIEDIMGEMFFNNFGRNSRNPFQHQQQKGNVALDDAKISLNISFEEAVLGCTKNISYEIMNFCIACEAQGIDVNRKNKCNICNGSGFQKIQTGSHGFIQISHSPCSHCKGIGVIGEPCPTCHGKKFKNEEINVNLKVPPIGDKQVRLFLKDKGHKYKNHTSNAYVHVIPEIEGKGDYSKYYIENENVKSTIQVSLDKLLFGGEEKVKTVGGEEVSIQINPLTKMFDEVIIKEKGVRGKNPGNHIVSIETKYPEKEKLTDELRDLIQRAYIK